jgi:predicted nucleic acid-binding Zn ribbon protein
MSDEATPLSASLDAVIRSLKGDGASAVAGVFGHWEEAVGEAISAHAKPVLLDNGRLLVEVDQPGWATQLRYLEKELLERLRPHLGGAELHAIEVRVARR